MDRLCCDFRVVGPVQTNCYFLYHEDTKKCLVIDPGDEAEKIISYIRKNQLEPIAILLTHGHFDHIGAVDAVRVTFGVRVYASEEEQDVLEDSTKNLSAQFGQGYTVKADAFFKDGQEMELLGQKMRCIATPGHTKGGMCYYFPKAGYLFSGDTLFQESVGRTDFPTGSGHQLIRSVREKVLVLPEAVRVYPGHGMMTSIQNERMFNPYAIE